MKKIGISIINFNGQENTQECLESIDKMVVPNDVSIQVIVVDNASKIPFHLIQNNIRKIPVSVILSKSNLGFSGGHNITIKKFIEEEYDYVLILNNDTTVEKSFLKELLSSAELHSNAGIIAPKIYFAKGFEFHKDRYTQKELGSVIWYAGGKMDWNNVLGSHRGVDEVDLGQYDTDEKTEFASGCCMLVKVEVFKKVGMFDERFFLYYEDNDLQEKVKKAGYSIIYSPRAIVWHKNAGSAGGSGSPLQDYYITRNRLLFGLLYAPLRARLALFKESIQFLFNGREQQKKAVKDFYLRNLGKGSYTS